VAIRGSALLPTLKIVISHILEFFVFADPIETISPAVLSIDFPEKALQLENLVFANGVPHFKD